MAELSPDRRVKALQTELDRANARANSWMPWRRCTAHAGEVDVLRDQLANAEKRADRVEIRADEAANRAIVTEQAIAGERNRADMAELRADTLRERLDAAPAELAADGIG